MNRKEEKWRNEGAAYALRVAKEEGVEHLEQDLRRRGAVGIPMNIPEKAIEATYDMLAKRIMNTMKTVAMWVLYEEHGWRSVRLQRFEQQMDKHSEACMSYDRYGQSYVKLSDMAKLCRKHVESTQTWRLWKRSKRKMRKQMGNLFLWMQ